jgi:glutamate:Na+ symporter, ESS family
VAFKQLLDLMTLSPWLLVLFAIPVLLLGDLLVKHVKLLARFNIPSPVVGGLLISMAVLGLNLSGVSIQFRSGVTAQWWTWLVTIEPEWVHAPQRAVHQPFLIGFFTCIGLNATWLLLKRGGLQVAIFLGLATVLAAFQNVIGLSLAHVLGESPLLGLACGSMSMTGGHGTAMGFAGEMEEMGLEGAASILVAAATFGLVAGGLIGGPIGGAILRKKNLRSHASRTTHLEMGHMQEGTGILMDLRNFFLSRRKGLIHLLLVLACIKGGAWVSFAIQQTGLTFPAYIGAMILGLTVRNVMDSFGWRWISTESVENLSAIMLGLFLAMALMSLNLIELAGAAVPMLVILAVQVTFVGLFAAFLTFYIMGRDYDAGIMSGGHCGFALGATPNAVANMKQLVERFGPAPRAFLVIPIVGAFLIDFTNVINITVFLNFLR